MKFLILLFAHLLADYPLQGPFLSEYKAKKILVMLVHCGIWTGCVATAAHFAGVPVHPYSIILLFFIHYLADMFKACGFYEDLAPMFLWYSEVDPLGVPLWIDQLIHVGQLLLLLYG